MSADDALRLGTRERLPDALRTLLAEYPREGWSDHAGMGALTRFWLERHGMFRQLLTALEGDARATVDGQMDPRAHAGRLQRLGGVFVNELHGHHSIEDAHYFPRLRALDPAVEQGFAILDADHHALDGQLDGFAQAANTVLLRFSDARDDERRDRAGTFLTALEAFHPLLDRHLVDEEEIIVPVLLKYGEQSIG